LTMRWKVFHGRKSMACANRVLPRYMATPGWRKPGTLAQTTISDSSRRHPMSPEKAPPLLAFWSRPLKLTGQYWLQHSN